MSKRTISSEHAPAAIGPYSQAVTADGWLYTAGQIGLDPSTGDFAGDDVASQARQVFRNLGAVLDAAGLGFADVVKTTIYLADMDDFGQVNDLYGRVFEEPYPARSTVEVCTLPKGALVEIDLVARRG